MRRSSPFLIIGIIALWTIGTRTPTPASAATGPPREITGVYVDVSRLRHDALSNGDTWDHIWADDDAVYSFACDGRGYGKAARNVAFGKLVGDAWDRLTGVHINDMDYGKANDAWPNGSNWKVTGADSIDGVFYAFVAENWYGKQNAFGGGALDPNIRQTVNFMSLIKSTDKGLTWTRDVKANYDHPMWSSRKFSTAFFVKYGQNGGKTKVDNQDKYVYAISNDGYWNCGSHFYLGRVLRSKIGNLSATDWEFLSNGRWSSNVDDATPVPGFPNGRMKCTMGSPIWLAAIHKYVTVTWYDPGTSQKWHYPENVTFAFYQADHPWGPWSYIGEKAATDFIGDPIKRVSMWYGPSLSPKFITNNPDGSVTAILTFSGQTWEDRPEKLYKNNSCPVTFHTRPQPKDVRIFNDTEAKYSKNWSYEQERNVGDYHNDAHVATKQGEYVDFTFTGRGIEVLAEKNSDMGEVKVLLDGVSQGTFSLYQDPMPRLYQVEFYRNMSLANGNHTVRVVNRAPNGTRCVIDGFRVYGGNDFDPNASYQFVNRITGKTLADAEWRIRPAGTGYQILNASTGKALDDKQGQLWRISAISNGYFSIENLSSDLAVTGTAGSGAVAAEVYFGRDIQKWEIRKTQ